MPHRPAVAIVFACEFLIITRSWVFRFMLLIVPGTVAAASIPVYLNPQRNWDWFAVPSTLPYLAALTATVLLSLAGAIIGADSIHRERTLDTIQSLHARPVANISIVTGKLLAIIAALGSIEMVAMIAALIINNGASDIPIQWSAYFIYPLLMTMPALIFVVGLTYTITSLTGSAMLASLVSWTCIITSIMLPLTSQQNIIDLTGFHVPLIYSDIAGFGNFPVLLVQRGMFCMLGIGLIMVSAVLFPRLHAMKRLRTWSGISSVVFLLSGIMLGSLLLSSYRTGIHTREQMRVLNINYADSPAVTITSCDLDVIHRGSSIHAYATITVTNATDDPLDSYIFSLNPGLSVTSVTDDGAMLSFQRDLHILAVTPPDPLVPGGETTIDITYRGAIDENACYTDIGEDERILPYGFLCCDFAKRYAFIRPDFVLLTPETLWYPMAGLPYGSVFPKLQKRDFIEFNLTVTTDTGLTPLSQGTVAPVQSGTTQFIPEYPLPGLSLVIGEYETHTVEVDSVAYSLYIKPGHDVFTPAFEAVIGDQLKEWIRDNRERYEYPFEGVYPYRRFSLVEVPTQFYTYPRLWSDEMQTVQPEIVFLPEKGYSCFRTRGDFAALINRSSRSNKSVDKENYALSGFLNDSLLFIDYGVDFSFEDNSPILFLGKERARNLSFGMHPIYSLFQINMKSTTHPYLASFIEKYIHYRTWRPPSYYKIRASGYLKNLSLKMVLTDSDIREQARVIQRVKDSELLAILESEIGEKPLRVTIDSFIAENRFRNCELDTLTTIIREKFAYDIDQTFHNWYTRVGVPGYVITDKWSGLIVHNNKQYHQVRFTIHNLEPFSGIVLLEGSEVAPESYIERFRNTILFEANQSKEVSIVFDPEEKSIVSIMPMLSKNIPNIIYVSFEAHGEAVPALPVNEVRTIEKQYVARKPGEIVIDNEDQGFEIINTQLFRRFFRSLITLEDALATTFYNPHDFGGLAIASYPEWQYVTSKEMFGLYAKTAWIISGGKGESRARWTANLPESGEYDLYYYSYYFDLNTAFNDAMFERNRVTHLKGIPTIGNYHFIVHGSGGVKNVILNMPEIYKQQIPTEAYLGTFTFDKGDAVIELTNETDGVYVFADAVKWVKR